MQFLTVLPIARVLPVERALPVTREPQVEPEAGPETQGRALIWYPAVGLVLGGMLTILAGCLPLPFYLTAAVVVAVWVILTGGLHLDGVADCADAWMGGLGDRDKTLRLLKDPLCGSMGVLSLILLLLLKTTALAVLITQGSWLWLWAIPLLSRLSLLLLFLTTPYIRPQGLGGVIAQHFPKPLAWGVILAVSIMTLLVLPLLLWLLWLVVVLLVFGCVRMATMKRLQGFTGDGAGALVELVEVALLLAATCLLVGT
ncbi:MAG: adenosylcobinamide-GDP ribazoletransferase [Porticoccaceae bacterium]|nr:MAG: adenosylcobinamide-GDP ribazoletransferase [Porticoccaceae bacterium]